MDPRIAPQFTNGPSLFPHMLDVATDRVLLSKFSETEFRSASFLDQRLLAPERARETVPWDALAAIDVPASPRPSYIFHIGHVGSTLISRLLGEHPNVLALREPHILRSFADISQIKTEPQSPWSPEDYEKRLAIAVSWLARGFRAGQRSQIKVSSFVSEIAVDLLAQNNKAVFLYVPLETYLESIFAGEGSRQEAQALAGARIMRLTRRASCDTGNLWELSEGQRIALGWMTEMLTLSQAAKAVDAKQILWQDFHGFLAQPAETLCMISQHLGAVMPKDQALGLISGPIMRSYSKAPEHDYSPKLRQDLLRQARREHGEEISKAASWVTSLAKTHKEIATLITERQKVG